MRVALVHDWLFGMRGGERCLEALCEMFPAADVYTLFYRPKRISATVNRHRIFPGILSALPGVEKYYRYLLPLFPFAIKDLSRRLRKREYDLVISVSHCVVKNIRPREGTPHLCYCLTPARYFWDQFDAYFSRSRAEPIIRPVIRVLRNWDRKAAAKNTRYVAISEFVRRRVRRALEVDSSVIYPPVRTDWITPLPQTSGTGPTPGTGFLCVNALVPYKRVHLVIEAFNRLGEELTIIGDGPEFQRLKALAGENIKFIKYLDEKDLATAYASTKALVFAAEEDFGIIPVEVQAAGRPVICFSGGGALETVVVDGSSRTGLLFRDAKADSIAEAVQGFLRDERQFSADNCIRNAARFSGETFKTAIRSEIEAAVK